MKRTWLLLAAALAWIPEALAGGPRQIPVERFIELPEDVRHPESITSDSEARELYVDTFDARTPESSRNNQLLRFSESGELLARLSFGATPLTGIQYRKGYVYVLNFGASKLQRVRARFDATSTIEDIAEFKPLAVASPTARRISNPDGSSDEIRFGS